MLAQRGERSRDQILSLDFRADDFIEIDAHPTLTHLWCGQSRKRDQVGQRQWLEQRAELVQVVLAAGAEVEAEVELGGGVDLHRRLKLSVAAAQLRG